MNAHTGHYDLVCEGCGKRIGGCKCLAPGKEKRPGGLCDECRAKQAPTPSKSSEKKFRFHWLSGKTNDYEGNDPANAFIRAGYGHGALKALDHWEEIPASAL